MTFNNDNDIVFDYDHYYASLIEHDNYYFIDHFFDLKTSTFTMNDSFLMTNDILKIGTVIKIMTMTL